MNNHRFTNFFVLILSLAVLGDLSPVRAESKKGCIKNAVYNGNFMESKTGWATLGPGYQAARLSVDKVQHEDVLITDLIVRSPKTGRTFTLYNEYPLKVKQGRKYKVDVTASGKGDFQIGAFEYNDKGNHIGNQFSKRCVLTDEVKTYSFVYTPGKNATSIRPAMVFLNTNGENLNVDARIQKITIPVHSSEFGEMCESWPDYAKDSEFENYKGFTKEELEKIQAVMEVNTVLPPYKPIVFNAPGDFTLTTSNIDFDQAVFPQTISVLGKEVLAEPMDLSVTLHDGTKIKLQPQTPTVHSTDQKAVLRQEYRASGKTVLTISAEMEYDALLVYTVEFPKNPGLSVSDVTLSISFPADIAKYIRYQHFPIFGSGIFGYGPIPEKGQKVETRDVRGSVHTRGAQANDWKPAPPGRDGVIWEWKHQEFPSFVWIGDEKRGVTFVCQSMEGYRVGKGDTAVRLVRQDREVRLTCRFITQKVSLDKERKLQFILQIMPPKPVRKDWFHTRFNAFFAGYLRQYKKSRPILAKQFSDGGLQNEGRGMLPMYTSDGAVARTKISPRIWEPKPHRKYRDIGYLWFSLWSKGSKGAEFKPKGAGCGTVLVGYPERLTEIMKYTKLLGHRALPYLAPTHIGATDPAGYYYVEKTGDWARVPRPNRPPSERPVCVSSLFAAYTAYNVGKMIDKYGITGIYFDNATPRPCMNEKHGCGYVDDDGKRRGTLPLLGLRKYYMTIRNEFVKRGKDPLLMTHAGMWPCAVSFLDINLDGEGTYGSDHTEMFTLGEWRTWWLGPNQFGVQETYLPSFGYGMGPGADKVHERRVGTPRLLAMSLLHGTWVWSQYTDRPVVYKAWEVLDELDEPDVAFIPYWEWKEINTPLNPQKLYATAYNGKEKMILVLSNLSGKEQKVTIPLSDILKKNPVAKQVFDHMHNLPVSIENGQVQCTIEPKNFRLLLFTK